MNYNKSINILVGIIFLLNGCSNKPDPIPEPPVKKIIYTEKNQSNVPESVSLNPSPFVDNASSINVPEWYVEPSVEIPRGYIGATASETSRNMQVAMEKAQNSARGQMRLQIKDIGEAGSDRFRKEIGDDNSSSYYEFFEIATRSASDSAILNTKTAKSEIQKDGQIYRAYILMIAPDPELEVINELKKDDELWIEFQKTEFFNDLHNRIEEYKKENNQN